MKQVVTNKNETAFEKDKKYTEKRHVLLIILLSFTALISVFASVSALLFVKFTSNVILKLEGDSEITLEYGDKYSEAGAHASSNGKELPVEISGSAGEEPGTYRIVYTVRVLWFTKKSARTVKIVDTVAPVITLYHLDDAFTDPNGEYIEEGFFASDNHDGDLTDKVVVERRGDTVLYTVSDSSGNTSSVTRTIKFSDVTPPVITLLGDAHITLIIGDEFSEPGFSAFDDRDGNITDRVSVDGEVDVMHVGEYTITYTVEDSFGNVAQEARIVKIDPISQPDVVYPNGKVIYLTFDDGPGKHTERLLEILDRYNVKATFFVVNSKRYIGVLDKIAAKGHSIGIHSVTHKWEIYSSESSYLKDLYGMQEIIRDQTGITTTLMRFPGGSSNRVSQKYCLGIMTKLARSVTDRGFQYFDWNVDSSDAGGVNTADAVYENVISGIKKHDVSVVLQHDVKEYSVDAVERIIIWGLKNGYSFMSLDPSSPTCHHRIRN